MVFEVRTTGNDTQCAGGFNSARGGTDYSQQDTAQATGTVTSATTTVTATTAIFTSAMVGNMITDGTTFKEITAYTSSTVVTVDSTPSWTAATIYVGGALASPGKACGVLVSSNTMWIKSGTYSITSASTNIAVGCLSFSGKSGTNAAFTKVIGYHTTRGDYDGTRPTLQASGISSFTIINSSANYLIIDNVILDCNSRTSGAGFNGGGSTTNIARRCKGVNHTGAAFNGIQGGVYDCEVTGGSGNGFVTISQIHRCYAHDMTGISINSSSCFDSICYNCTNAQGAFFSNTAGVQLKNCTAYGCAVGFDVQQSAMFENCISYGNSAYGFKFEGVYGWCVLLNCAAGNNTTANYLNATELTGFVNLTSDPFTNAASGDFSLGSTAGATACKGAGIPGVFPGGLSTGHLDIGAVQSAGGAGGGIINQPLRSGGGM